MYEGVWVFDDANVDLVREPFVMGIDEIMTKSVIDIKEPEKGFNLLFSSKPFPGATITLERLYEEFDGNWYKCTELDHDGWLCPALFKYFDEAPKHIYAQIKEKC